MNQYLKFKEWTEKKSTQAALNIFIVVWIVTISLVAGILLERNGTLSRILGVSTRVEPTSLPTEIPIPTNSPTPFPTYPPVKTYVDPDPIVNCGPGQNSKQYVRDRSSNCKNYVDCGLNNNTLWTMMLKSECDNKHIEQKAAYDKTYKETYDATYKSPINPNEVTCPTIGYSQERKVWTYILTSEECNLAKANENSTQPTNIPPSTPSYPPCTVYYSALNSTSTFNYMSPEACKTAQDAADTSGQDYNNAVGSCLNRMRALGIANSSVAQQCYSNPNVGL